MIFIQNITQMNSSRRKKVCTFCGLNLTNDSTIFCDGVIGFMNVVSENTVIGCDAVMCRNCATKIGFSHYHSEYAPVKKIIDTIDLCPICNNNRADGELNIVTNVESAKRAHLALINRRLFRIVK